MGVKVRKKVDEKMEEMIPEEIKTALYERVVVPIVLYGSETGSLNVKERRKLEVFEVVSKKYTQQKKKGLERGVIVS